MNLDVFNGDAFTMTSLSSYVNKQPHIPSMLRDLKIFTPKPVRTTNIWVEVKNGSVSLIPTTERGAPKYQNEKQKRDAVPLRTVRVAQTDKVTSEELQDVRAEGEEAMLKEAQVEVNMRLDEMLGNVDLTEENLFLGAIQGTIVDADGSTVIYDLYDEFDVTQPAEIDFDLDNASPASGALKTKCNEVIRGMVRAGGNAFTSNTQIMAFVGDDFWDALVSHTEVQGAYNNWMAAQSLSNEVGVFKPFRWGEISWVNYRGTDDGSTVAIGTDKAKFFPVGARGLFEVAYAPGEGFSALNKRGQERYAMLVPDPTARQEYIEIDVATYLLPYCTKPEVLFRGIM